MMFFYIRNKPWFQTYEQNGPNAFETASKIHTEAPPEPAQPNNHGAMGPPKFQVPPKGNNEDTRRSSGYQNSSSTGAGLDNKTTSHEERSSGVYYTTSLDSPNGTC